MKPGPVACALFLLGFLSVLVFPGEAQAQGEIEGELLNEPACLQDINSEECICARVRVLGSYPIEYGPPGPAGNPTAVDKDMDGETPDYEDGEWVESEAELANGISDLIFTANDNYKDHCSLAYFREDLRRFYIFLVALGVGFTAISLSWAGVIWMQHSSSGEDLRQVRVIVIRVVLGMIILASAYVIYDGASDLLQGRVESWSLDRDTYYGID